MARIAARRVRVLEVETATPSPFAASLLFGYVGAFMYEGDSPLAERRAAALSLDTALLAELLGRVELRELLDPDVVATTARQLQHLTPERAARDAEAVADLLRLLGPLTEDEIAERSTAADVGAWLEGLHGRTTGAAGVLRRPVVVGRDRGHRPAARRGGCRGAGRGARDVHRGGRRPTRRVARPLRPHPRAVHHRGGGRPLRAGPAGRRRRAGPAGRRPQTDPRRIHRHRNRSRRHPSSGATARSCASCGAGRWPHCVRRSSRWKPRHTPGSCPRGSRWDPTATSGIEGLASVIDQLAGVAIPASAVEPLVFGQRVRDYTPAMLDELLASGEVIWSGMGPIAGGSSGSSDGWVAFHLADNAPLTLTPPTELDLTDTHRAILDALDNGGAYFFRQLSIDGVSAEALKEALWQLIWSGRATGDTFAPVRAMLSGTRRSGTTAHRHRRAPRLSRYSVAHAQTRRHRPDRRRPVVGAAGRRAGFDGPRALPGRTAVGPLRRADPGRGGRRERSRAGSRCSTRS